MAATIFTQLTMLNMIIAIMGDTFERISENKEVYATISKLELLGEYAFALKDGSSADNNEGDFLYVMEPVNDDQIDLGAW